MPFDLVIDRSDHCINLCEMRYHTEPLTLSAADAEELDRKKAVFREKTRTRKTVFTTLIAPNGVHANEYSQRSVQHVLTADNLFGGPR